MNDAEDKYFKKTIIIRSIGHFHMVAAYMNEAVGHGRENWRAPKKITHRIQRRSYNNEGVEVDIRVNNKHKDKMEGFDLFVSLL